MLRRYLDLNMLSSLLLLSSIALADGPKFSVLGELEPAPFEGVLFDPEATAILMSDREFWSSSCDLEIEFQLDKQATKYKLEFENAQISYKAASDEYNLIVEQKDLEIEKLTKILKKQSPYQKWLWFGGGVAATVFVVNLATNLVAASK